MSWVLRRVREQQRGDDSGFTLIEAIVALSIAALVFTALAYAGVSAIKSSYLGRANQQAADLATQQVEQLRLLDYGSLGHEPSDLTGDPAIGNCAGDPCIDPGTGSAERLVEVTGGISPHVQLVQSSQTNNTAYTLSTYVTQPSDAYGADYRRVTVRVSWSSFGQQRERVVSTIVTVTQRGLPLPLYKITPVGPTSISVNRGADVVYGLLVANQGAPDRFTIEADGDGSWNLVLDDGDGVYEAGTDVDPLPDSNSDGRADTGRVNPGTTMVVWAIWSVSGTETTGTYTTVFRGTSIAQPAAAGAVQSVSTTTAVVDGVVTPSPSVTPSPTTSPVADCVAAATPPSPTAASGHTLVGYTLHNSSAFGPWAGIGDSAVGVQKLPLSLDRTPPLAADLTRYATDVSPGGDLPGRVLEEGGAFSTTTSTDYERVVDWRTSVDRKAYSGTAVLTLYVAGVPAEPTALVDLAVQPYVWKKVSGTYRAVAQGSPVAITVSPFTCAGFQPVHVSLPLNVTLSNNQYLGFQVINEGTDPVRLAYDVASTYPASVVLPEK
jgi:prepilin-type N-terminal cleavage/methylation domain-containing protein